MKNYADMNDSQINILVCKAVGKGMSDYCRIMDMNDHTILLADNKTLFDPCNSWADAGPIITENKIALIWYEVDKAWDASANYKMEDCCWEWEESPEHYTQDANPLRAAMIVFLMMNDHD